MKFNVNDLAIPATHDSMNYYKNSINKDLKQTSSESFVKKLNAELFNSERTSLDEGNFTDGNHTSGNGNGLFSPKNM